MSGAPSVSSESRTALVTGGGSGIGRGVCLRLARDGHRIAVLDIDGDAAASVASEIVDAGARAIPCAVDVSKRNAVDAAVDLVRNELGPVGIVVTSAALAPRQRFEEITVDEWRTTFAVNVEGTFHCIQAVIGDMVARGWGRVVTIASSSAQAGTPLMAHYASSKGAVISLTRTLAREFASRGITVNCIPPSSIDTPMMRKAISEASSSALDESSIAARIPVGRFGTPDDVAAMCAFLCSEEAGYITGQVLGVNGGSYI